MARFLIFYFMNLFQTDFDARIYSLNNCINIIHELNEEKSNKNILIQRCTRIILGRLF